MKSLAALFIFLLITILSYSQNMSCSSSTAVTSGATCTMQSAAFTGIYEDYYNSSLTNWIPTSSTPIKTVKVNFIIVQDDNGNGNFSSSGTGCFGISHEAFLTDVIQRVNNIYSNLDDPSDNGASAICGACNQNKDTKVRFAIQGFHYYRSSAEYGIASTVF